LNSSSVISDSSPAYPSDFPDSADPSSTDSVSANSAIFSFDISDSSSADFTDLLFDISDSTSAYHTNPSSDLFEFFLRIAYSIDFAHTSSDSHPSF
jgi:hypothetical protein